MMVILKVSHPEDENTTHLLRLSRSDCWRRRGPEAVAGECELREGVQHFGAAFQVAERISENNVL